MPCRGTIRNMMISSVRTNGGLFSEECSDSRSIGARLLDLYKNQLRNIGYGQINDLTDRLLNPVRSWSED